MNGNKNLLMARYYVGGLIATQADTHYRATHRILNKIPDTYKAPQTIDNRGTCTQLEDQQNTPECAAFSCTTLIESIGWKRTHIPIQLDPHKLYAEAKQVDMDDEDGTTFTSVFAGAKKLGWIPQESKLYSVENFKEYLYAIHEYDFCLLGFDVSSSWADTKYDGWVRLSGNRLGGHAVVGCNFEAFNNNGLDFAGFRNSWGDWGAKGFGRINRDDFEASFIGGAAIYIPETENQFLPQEV